MMEAVAPLRLVDGSRLNGQLDMMRKECALHDKERYVWLLGFFAVLLWVFVRMCPCPRRLRLGGFCTDACRERWTLRPTDQGDGSANVSTVQLLI